MLAAAAVRHVQCSEALLVDSLLHSVEFAVCLLPRMAAGWTMAGALSNPWSWIDPGAFALVGAGAAALARHW
jgi:hypothetical protein